MVIYYLLFLIISGLGIAIKNFKEKMLLCYNKGCGKEYSENGEGKLLP